jgi:uncharacterized protein (UPF0261 family)
MAVLLIGTLDTKGVEFAYIRDRLTAAGVSSLVADAGSIGPPPFAPDIAAAELFALAKTAPSGDRNASVRAAAIGAAALARKLFAEGRLTGVFGMGGSAGTVIGTAAMRAVPVGIPKVMVSTLASGDVRPYVGTRDIAMFHSVVDIAGLNRISRMILDNAAAAMIGMVLQIRNPKSEIRNSVAATMFGVTTSCVQAARGHLEADGMEVVTFHATGTGGRTMEELIAEGQFDGVLDITTTELADELVGGVMPAGPDRLTAAALRGIPQVISVGALDMVNFGARNTVPAKFAGRRFHEHTATVTLMRTTPEENDRLGQEIAQKACAAKGPTAILLPLRGVSGLDAEGGPFWWPEADDALFQSLRNWIAGVELIELDLHINDPEFARVAAQTLRRLMGR